MPNDDRAAQAERFLLRVLAIARSVGKRVWENDRYFYVALTVFNLFVTRRIWRDGIFADNDSVCHYAYLRHLVDEFYPKTGTFLGFSPKFNMGVPFLLYNTPPGIYVASAVTSSVLHVSALMGMKLCMLVAFCTVPLAGAAIAKTFEDEPKDLPKFTALAFALFSSELFGLEFYFKNGMLNPAFALPMMLGSLAMLRNAQIRSFPASLPYLGMGGVLFAATLMTHVLTAYMFCVALIAFTFGPGFKELGVNAIKAGILLAVGGLLSAEWLIPSMLFAAKEDAAYTWLRPPTEVWGSFLRGEMFSSYPVGFFPTFLTQSSASSVAILAALVGAYFAFAKKNAGARAAAILFVLAFWIVLGPTYSTGISILPVYDRLLWYRFVTLAAVGLFLLAGYGAWKFSSHEFRYYPLNVLLLGAAGIWSFYVMTQRAVKIHCASEFPQFVSSVEHVSTWLKEHGDKRGRVYSEFLGQGVVQPPSVNYTRHMIPILSGFDEVSGWIYENNPASQELQREGPFWYNPFPMIAHAETYDVKYVVAGSPQLIHALSDDPRWKLRDATPDLELFEATTFEPSLLSWPGSKLDREGYEKGGGYLYDFTLDVDHAPNDAPLVVRTNWAPVWTATVDGKPVKYSQTAEGLLQIEVPKDLHGLHALHLRWSIEDVREKGHKLTLLGFLTVLVFFAVARFSNIVAFASKIPVSIPNAIGAAGVAAAVALLAWRSRNVDLTPIGYGIRGGLYETVNPKGVTVGAYDDDAIDRLVRVLPAAWGPRETDGDGAARSLEEPHESDAVAITLSPGKNRLIVKGHANGGDDAFIAKLAVPRSGQPACEAAGHFGEPIDLPASCLAQDTDPSLPGIVRHVAIDCATPATIASVAIENDIVVIEGESFENAYDDGGYDAFYGIGGVERFAENGVTMGGDALLEQPIVIKKKIPLAAGKRYEMWALIRVLHERFRETRATLFFEANDVAIGSLDGVAKHPIDFWDRDLRFEWEKVGEWTSKGIDDVRIRFEKNQGAVGGLADIDTVAFIPALP